VTSASAITIIDGKNIVCIHMRKSKPILNFQILDSRHLVIDSVSDESTGTKLEFNVAPEGYVGSKLEIQLPQSSAEE
jgi:hypothetical protein